MNTNPYFDLHNKSSKELVEICEKAKQFAQQYQYVALTSKNTYCNAIEQMNMYAALEKEAYKSLLFHKSMPNPSSKYVSKQPTVNANFKTQKRKFHLITPSLFPKQKSVETLPITTSTTSSPNNVQPSFAEDENISQPVESILDKNKEVNSYFSNEYQFTTGELENELIPNAKRRKKE